MQRKWNYFSEQEVEGLDYDYIGRLDLARGRTIELDPLKKGVPFIITSGYRSPEKNQSLVGAVPDSAHTKGLATDLAVHSSHEVALVVEALLSVGITRIGIYVDESFQPVHIHNDVDPDKPPQVLFVKMEKN